MHGAGRATARTVLLAFAVSFTGAGAATSSFWPFSSLSPQAIGCPDECHGRGACKDGKCFCFGGWVGVSCNEHACDACAHGSCVKGECKCSKGWAGSRCDEPACPNDCSSHGSCVNGTCHCADGFGGADCGHAVCPRGCSGRGTCTKAGCVCELGYAGPGCGRRACPNEPEGGQGVPCSGRGTCYGGRCLCRQPYGGEDCSMHLAAEAETIAAAPTTSSSVHAPTVGSALAAAAVRGLLTGPCAGATHGTTGFDFHSSPCGPNGRCERDSEVCHCFAGWTGALCDEPTCLHNCSGRGECGAGGVCVCSDGYRGVDCSIAPSCPRGRASGGVASAARLFALSAATKHSLPAGGTADDPIGLDCSGRGVCDQGECRCFVGWTGPACESKACPGSPPCHGRGSCLADGSCACEPGWTGLGCAIRTCAHLSDCHGRGFCADGSCVCSEGWTGDACEARECLQGCGAGGHGTCDVASGKCVCADGWSGELCDEPPACPNGCSGHGACVHGKCVCEANAGGADCSELTCPGGCSGHGSCNTRTGVCECDAGYEGTPNCEHKACEKDCHHNGLCSDGKCVCFGGFIGKLCEDRSCGFANCTYPHGKCDRRTGQCACAKGYEGKDCASKSCNGGKGCSGNGVCQRGVCICRAGWRGEACDEIETCVGGCGGKTRGECMSAVSPTGVLERRCRCKPGFSGVDCSLSECNPVQPDGSFRNLSLSPAAGCGLHGYCDGVSGGCVCAPGWSGPRCDVRRCPKDCAHAGLCVGGSCVCEAGRVGAACDEHACDDPTCAGHGTCVRGVCMCDAGFVGKRCESKGCPGAPKPCGGVGKCVATPATPARLTAASAAASNANSASREEVNASSALRMSASERRLAVALPPSTNSTTAMQLAERYRAAAVVSFPSALAIFQPLTLARCECPPGRGGQACEQLLCPVGPGPPPASGGPAIGGRGGLAGVPCSGNGRCDTRSGTCECTPPWHGPSCSLRGCAANCSSHGTCDPLSGACVCNEGWGGPLCERPGCAMVGGYECAGPSHGWCDTRRRTCVCAAGWGGPACAVAQPASCPHNCSGHGECVAGRSGSGVSGGGGCVCEAGWRGVDCSRPVCPADCNGRGGCRHDGTCACDAGWSGPACDVGECPNDCDGHGACLPTGECACFKGFGGVDCSRHRCVGDCGEGEGRGQCADGGCQCKSGWSGAACDRPTCHAGCNGRGLCVGAGDAAGGDSTPRCMCREGFWGEACEHGCLRGCSKRGVCTSGGKCECGGGWRGPDCALPPMRLDGCAAKCAATCSRQCEPHVHARQDDAAPAEATGAADSMVEQSGRNHQSPAPAADGFLWRGERSDKWACARACSAVCVARCEEDESEAGLVE